MYELKWDTAECGYRVCTSVVHSEHNALTYKVEFNVLLTVHHAMILGNCPT